MRKDQECVPDVSARSVRCFVGPRGWALTPGCHSEFQLPVQLRDAALGKLNDAPNSDVNKREYSNGSVAWALDGSYCRLRVLHSGNGAKGAPDSLPCERTHLTRLLPLQIANGLLETPSASSTGKEILKGLARNDPFYKRNRPHVCSFFVKGECTRGAECPFRCADRPSLCRSES